MSSACEPLPSATASRASSLSTPASHTHQDLAFPCAPPEMPLKCAGDMDLLEWIPEEWRRDWLDLVEPGAATDFFALEAMPPFPAVGNAFDPHVALWMSEFCRLIYRRFENEGDGLRAASALLRILATAQTGWKDAVFFDGRSEPSVGGKRRFWRSADPAAHTQAALITRKDPDVTVLVFRGTLGPANLITDLSFLAWPLRLKLKGSAHFGFSAALDSVWHHIRRRLLGTTGKIVVTGHSLGGALGTLAACRMLADEALRDRVEALYTFGCPRVGTHGFEENLSGLYHARIVHEDDLVARIPPAFSVPPFPVYRHVGSLHPVNRDGRLGPPSAANADAPDPQQGVLEFYRLLRQIAKGLKHNSIGAPPKPLKDHTPRLYTIALHGAVRGGPPSS